MIVIKQEDPWQKDPHFVILDTSDAEKVANWLFEAVKERQETPDDEYEDLEKDEDDSV